MDRFRCLALVTVLALTGACDSEPDDVEAPPATTTAWRELGTWAGTGGRQTESFGVTSGALRLTWEASKGPSPERPRLRVSLHSAISGRPLHTAVDVTSAGSDTVRIPTEPRIAYLLVESEGVEWSLRLEEGVPGGEPFP